MLANWAQELAYLDAQVHTSPSLPISLRDAVLTGSMTSVAGTGGLSGKWVLSCTGGASGTATKEFSVPASAIIDDISWYAEGSAGTELQLVTLNALAQDGTTSQIIQADGTASTSYRQYAYSTFASLTGGTVTGSLPVTSPGTTTYQMNFGHSLVGTEIIYSAIFVVSLSVG